MNKILCKNNLLWALIIGLIIGSCCLVCSIYTGDETFANNTNISNLVQDDAVTEHNADELVPSEYDQGGDLEANLEPVQTDLTARMPVRVGSYLYNEDHSPVEQTIRVLGGRAANVDVAAEATYNAGKSAVTALINSMDNMSVEASTVPFMAKFGIGGFVGGFVLALLVLLCLNTTGDQEYRWLTNKRLSCILGGMLAAGVIFTLYGFASEKTTDLDAYAILQDHMPELGSIHGKYAAVFGAGAVGSSGTMYFLLHKFVVFLSKRYDTNPPGNVRVMGTPGIEMRQRDSRRKENRIRRRLKIALTELFKGSD